MNTYDITIVGGGAAGFFAAAKLLEKDSNIKILIIEKEAKPLQKLLITGSGSCNFTHSGSVDNFLHQYGNNGQFLRNAFYNFFVEDIVSYFEENGIKTFCRDDGKYFPLSMKANDIKQVLMMKTQKTTIVFESQIQKISEHNSKFYIETSNAKYISNALIIATGGKSFPKTGSTGDGYAYAKNFGHTIIQPKASLANIMCHNHHLSILSGISFNNAKISYQVKNRTKKYIGDLLITHKGFSGPLILNNSRDFSSGDELTISFISEHKEEFETELRKKQNDSVLAALKSYIPKKMIHVLCSDLLVDQNKKICEVSNKDLRKIIDFCVSYSITISVVEGFESCMCTSGGISLKEVNPKTFESKLVSNLYFLGEVLDIDGNTGGYNLQAIWSECALFAKNYH